MWLSFLIRADKVGEGDVFVVPNNEVSGALGKVRGNQFSIYLNRTSRTMEIGRTYLLVSRIDFGNSDSIHLWVDPALSEEPDLATADVKLTTELGVGNVLNIRGQGYGLGVYSIDEIRLGTSWAAVGGRVNPQDFEPPSPELLTWVAPPSVQPDGSLFMQAATATDQSGVQYYFECLAGAGPDSGWQDAATYRVQSPSAGSHTYRVKARDLSVNRNETEWSFESKVEVGSQQ